MELFLAQNHSALTHLPIASAILAAIGAIVAMFSPRKEIGYFWSVLSIVAFVTVLPLAFTGIFAAQGRFNDTGKPYLESGILVSSSPANERIRTHELLAITGSVASLICASLGLFFLRGRRPNIYLVVLLAITVAVLWGIGGHLGGKELWGPDTFPAFVK